jgi:hypothetical protein
VGVGGEESGMEGGSFLVIKFPTSILKYQFIPIGKFFKYHILTNSASCEQPQTLESLKSIREYTSCFMIKYVKYKCVVLLFSDCVATFTSDHTLCN